MQIRPFRYDTVDYERYVTLYNSIISDKPASLEFERRQDEEWPEGQLRERVLVLDEEGDAQAAADYNHLPWSFHPNKFGFMIFVRQDVRRRGLGTALFNYMLEALAPYEPQILESATREDWPEGLRFLEKRGFQTVNREQSSELDPANFDASRFAPLLASVAASGLQIKSLREVMDTDPDTLRKLCDLENELAPDIPWYDDPTPQSFEDWVKGYEDNPDLLPDGYFIALDGTNFAGVSHLWGSQASDRILYTGFTGVRRPYRKRGVATALKVHAIEYARNLTSADGQPVKIVTSNEQNNLMLQINLHLGFQEQPAWLIYVLEL
ncbi:MAG: GNAT family N-acetyltransferase [Candidatus Promineifilaceae bacterium]|nr:GNAT family N-acetyltransferase [Candidatus Promineifilaceae bacterium]